MKNKVLFVSVVVCLLLASHAFAQYKVFCWDNFENGSFPQTLKKIHDANDKNVQVISYDSLLSNPKYSKIQDGIARTECGRYGLYFTIPKADVEPKPNGVFLSIVSDIILDRKTLKNGGKAIIQADFFMPEEPRIAKPAAASSSIPGIAVLGVGGINPHLFDKWAIYRVGMSPTYQVFFSFLDASKGAAPILYHVDKLENMKLQVTGWHRFQIVFQGSDVIGGYVDGVKTSFSPINEGSITSLRMGLMISSSSKADKECIIDNLSIQIADENLPLPTSPWMVADIGANSQKTVSQGFQKPDFSDSNLRWFLTPEDAVQYNKGKNLPYLILFYSPLAKTHKTIEAMINADSNFQRFLKNYVLTRLDVNQLNGGKVAEYYGIFRVPCFVALDSNGNKKSMIIFKENMKQDEIINQINAGFK